jgi:hypothetical protein
VKIALLETSPAGPMEGAHDHLRNDSRIDVFDITHDCPIDTALFSPASTWAANRNILWQHVPKDYDYYWFIDYDVRTCGDIDTIVAALSDYKPAVAFPAYVRDPKQSVDHIRSGVFNNNMSVLFAASAASVVFPMPERFGGFWDAATYVNLLSLAWYPHVIDIAEVVGYSMVSSDYAANCNQSEGIAAMQACFEWCREWLVLPDTAPHSIVEFKTWMRDSSPSSLPSDGLPFNQRASMARIIDTSHEWFKGRVH